MGNILLIGASGLLGGYFLKSLNQQFNIFVVEHNTKINLPESQKVKISQMGFDEITNFISKNQISIIINLAALTSVDKCEENLKLAVALNTDLAVDIAQVAKVTETFYVLISTDHLYGNFVEKKTENDEVSLINNYAKTKYRGEVLAIEQNRNTLIVRTNFYGRSLGNRVSFSDWLYNEFWSGSVVKALTDVYYSPVSMRKLTELLMPMLNAKVKGVFNFSSDQVVTKYDFALKFANLMHFPEKLVQPVNLVDLNLLTKRPKCMALDNSKLKAHLNLRAIDLHDDLELTCNEYIRKKS